MDRNCGIIRLDEKNTVKSLRDKLQQSALKGYADSGFPILKVDRLNVKVVGYIGMNELEHALGKPLMFTLVYFREVAGRKGRAVLRRQQLSIFFNILSCYSLSYDIWRLISISFQQSQLMMLSTTAISTRIRRPIREASFHRRLSVHLKIYM